MSFENLNQAKEVQTSFLKIINETKESQTSFLENSNEEKLSQTSFNESNNCLETICQCSEKINLLQENIQNYLKEISDLHNSCELKEKQVSLSKEKVSIQEQIISSLKNELALKNKEVISEIETSIHNKYLDLKHAASQTYYLNSKFYSPIKDEMNGDLIYEQSTPKNHMVELSRDSTEQSVSDILNSNFQLEEPDNIINERNKDTVKNCDYIVDQTREQYVTNCELNIILEELLNLKGSTLKLMKDNMQLAYLGDISEKELDTQDKNTSDLVKMEIKMLRDMISRIEFYLKDRSEASDYLNNVLAKQMEEMSSLQQQFSETEMCLKEKETHLESLRESLSSLKKNALEKLSVHMPITHFEFSEFEVNAYTRDINYLEKTIDLLENLVRDKESSLATLKKEKSTNETQTDEVYPDTTENNKVCAEKEEMLQNEIISLKQTIKELCQESKDLNQELQLKTTNLNEMKESYEKKLNDAKLLTETKENNWELKLEKMKECIKNIEEKCEQEINEQEKEFFTKIKELGEQYQLQLIEKQETYKEEVAQLKTFHAENLSKLEEYYESLLSESDRFVKLEEEIRQYKKREDNLKLSYVQLKSKFKQYMLDVKQMRLKNEKSYKDKEIQTQFESVSEARKSDEICKQCASLQQKLTNLHDQIKIKNAINQLDEVETKKDLVNELGLKKAKIISLQTDNSNMSREIAALKKELASKSTLLKSCNCRLIPKNVLKSAKSETIPDVCKVDDANSRHEKNKDVLELDIVKKAIQLAREEERSLFERGMGPASDLKCLLLHRKLNKKEKEILELKDLVTKKKSTENVLENRPLLEKRAAIENKFPSEYQPHKAPPGEEENFTPNKRLPHPPLVEIEPHQKVRPKNILTQKNKPATVPQSEEPVKKPFQAIPATEEEKEKELQRQLRIMTGEPDVPDCKQQ